MRFKKTLITIASITVLGMFAEEPKPLTAEQLLAKEKAVQVETARELSRARLVASKKAAKECRMSAGSVVYNLAEASAKYPDTFEYISNTDNYDFAGGMFSGTLEFSAKNAFGVPIRHKAYYSFDKDDCTTPTSFSIK